MLAQGERRWVRWFAVGVAVLTTLPYLAGYAFQTDTWRYSGLLVASEDGFSYLAKMLSGAAGNWLFSTPYTLEPQAGFLAFLPYLLLGKLTSPPGQYEQLVALFHLLRVAGGCLAVLATYDFFSLFIQPVGWRRLALVTATLGGGLGILSIFGLGSLWKGPMPLEFYSPETFGFLGILAIPHLAWARALLLWGLVRYLNASHWKDALMGGWLWLAMGFFQPLAVVVGWTVLAAHLAFNALRAWRSAAWQSWFAQAKKAIAIGCLSAPLVVYTFISFQVDGFLKRWQAQNILLSPPAGDYLLAFGLALPLAVLGAVWSFKHLDEKNSLLLAWFFAFPVLAYLPYNLQRRLPEGFWVALVALACLGALRLAPKARRWVPVWLSIGLLPGLALLSGAFASLLKPGYPLFRPAGELAAYSYLAEHAEKGASVLASYDTSTVLPAHVFLRVAIGHGPESLGVNELKPRVERFFQPSTDDSERRSLLNELGIDFVFWGPLEKQLGSWNPEVTSYLRPVFSQDGYEIFSYEAPQ